MLAFLLSLDVYHLHAFITHDHRPLTCQRPAGKRYTSPMYVKRYGPPSEEINPNQTQDRSGIKSEFTSLLHQVMSLKEEEIPSILTKNINTIINVMETRDLLEEIIEDETINSRSSYYLEEVSDAVNTIVTFVESFVEHTSEMEGVYKKLLGKIFKLITPAGNNQIESEDTPTMNADRFETELDKVLAEEKEAFTPGFLRHLEGECDRIGTGKGVTPESSKMLQILRVIQARVLEELGKVCVINRCCTTTLLLLFFLISDSNSNSFHKPQGIGDGAIMLGQLLGYDNKAERLAVLDAGLTVRGVEFAVELSALTSEALEGFKTVKGVDPGLVVSIEEIDERIALFMDKNKFQ